MNIEGDHLAALSFLSRQVDESFNSNNKQNRIMKEKIILIVLGIIVVAMGTTAIINFIQGNVLQGVSDVLMLCYGYILAWVLIRQKFQLDVIKVIGKSHFAWIKVLKKAFPDKLIINDDDNNNEEVEISEKEMTEDEKRIKRMCEEYNQLAHRYKRLTDFLASDKFKTLSEKSCTLLEQQHKAMGEYMEALKQRIELECDNNNKKEG